MKLITNVVKFSVQSMALQKLIIISSASIAAKRMLAEVYFILKDSKNVVAFELISLSAGATISTVYTFALAK